MPRIAVLIDTSIGLNRHIIRGIAQYAQEHPTWELAVELVGTIRVPRWRLQMADAVICRPRTSEQAALVASLDCPRFAFTSLSSWEIHDPRIMTAPDFCGATAARLAAKHLQAQGLRHFAYVPHPLLGPLGRAEPFEKAVRRGGGSYAQHAWPDPSPGQATPVDLDDLAKWLRALPRPVGVLGANDICARDVLEACRHARLQVPLEVAVMGVDNDEFICELTKPALTSVIAPGERMGYRAAQMVASHLAGKPPRQPRPVRPTEVAVRLSTDTVGVPDPVLAEAVRYIRTHALEGISVADVAAAVPLSRRTMEVRMRSVLGISPAAEIERVRVTAARQLIRAGELSLKQVAARCGYRNQARFYEAFVRVMGRPPSAYRQQLTRAR